MYTRSDNAACANFVAAISRTNSNWFEFLQLIAATQFCHRSNNDFHKINHVTRGKMLQRLFPAMCYSDLLPNVSWALKKEREIPRESTDICHFLSVIEKRKK